MTLNPTIDQEVLRDIIYHNTGWNFMCLPEYKKELEEYCRTGDLSKVSPEAWYQLNGIYRDLAQEYEYFTGGKYLPNIFIGEKGEQNGLL